MTFIIFNRITDVEALRIFLNDTNIENRLLLKLMHCHPAHRKNPRYTNGVSESLFRVGICLPAGPYVTDDVRYIVNNIKDAIGKM